MRPCPALRTHNYSLKNRRFHARLNRLRKLCAGQKVVAQGLKPSTLRSGTALQKPCPEQNLSFPQTVKPHLSAISYLRAEALLRRGSPYPSRTRVFRSLLSCPNRHKYFDIDSLAADGWAREYRESRTECH